ncbi:hypothetical protein EB796_004907 [Bugula neritina]|uniref:Uncharacterized protein n=1 Tax=Bugula neritina TaxID=10212 RepID=A0A7J7KDQ7_BUGNE|nr:hypothetical protein EB796_004907 [Bugula neritina]
MLERKNIHSVYFFQRGLMLTPVTSYRSSHKLILQSQVNTLVRDMTHIKLQKCFKWILAIGVLLSPTT